MIKSLFKLHLCSAKEKERRQLTIKWDCLGNVSVSVVLQKFDMCNSLALKRPHPCGRRIFAISSLSWNSKNPQYDVDSDDGKCWLILLMMMTMIWWWYLFNYNCLRWIFLQIKLIHTQLELLYSSDFYAHHLDHY